MRRSTLAVPVALLLALAACAAAEVAPLPLAELARGQFGPCEQPRREVVRDAARWAVVWREVQGGVDAPPAVDFDGQMVVVACLGLQRSGGHAIEIVSVALKVEEGDDALEIVVRERHPAPGAITTQALTQPFHAVRVARSSAPVRWLNAP